MEGESSDLTRLDSNNRGQFPAARVRKVIMGDESLKHTVRARCQSGDLSFAKLKGMWTMGM